MVYNNISLEQVLGKIFRDLNLKKRHWTHDAVEWIAEALEEIGAFPQLEERHAILQVDSHSAPLPIDIVQLLGVFRAPLASDTDRSDFIASRKHPVSASASTAHDGVHAELGTVIPSADERNYITHKVNNGYIYIDDEIDLVGITYLGMPVDSQGWPMVPDKIEYKDALLWYVAKKLRMSGQWSHPEFSYEYCDQKWMRACTKARNSANMLDIPKAESFYQHWVVNMQNSRYLESFKADSAIVATQAYGSEGIIAPTVTPL